VESTLNTVATLLGLAAIFGYLNHRVLKLPPAIGLVIIAMAASLGALAVDALLPGLGIGPGLRQGLAEIDFTDTLMKGMLSFLLFAGALHVDLSALASRKWVISAMATVGVLITTGLVAGAMWLVFSALGIPLPFVYCLVFGALIAPTDPVAVLGILKSTPVPPSLEVKIAGESLFNDGVGVVVFAIMVALAVGASDQGAAVGFADIIVLFLQEAVGGVVLGLVAGLFAFWAMRSIDEHNLEVIITLALVTVTYRLADALHTSGPIAMVVAGLIIGNHGTRFAMSETTRAHLLNFWSLTDEILNAVLFLLIGLEVVVISATGAYLWAAAAAIPVVLASRLISVSLPIWVLGFRQDFTKGAIPVLTWGGLRGGISVALALSLPASPERDVILAVTYAVVVFSIIVQGLTVGPLVRRVVKTEP
jgi:CPA1 family monovalent cation:H+ antiporter